MKKCPNCQNTYDDSLKFCQKDGTPLVVVAEDEPEDSPFKTTVGKKEDVSAPPEEKEPEPEIDPFATMVAGAKLPEPKEEDVLEVPDKPVDPMATMVVSGETAGKIEVDVPEERSEASGDEPEPPAADETDESAAAEPASPAAPEDVPDTPAAPQKEDTPAKPIPSPFDESMPPGFEPPKTPPFETPESPVEPVEQAESPVDRAPEPPVTPEALPTDFEDVEEADIEPAVPESSMPAPMSGQAMEPAGESAPEAASDEGVNQTMAFIALALGIISLLCCTWMIPGVAAIIVGFMARNKAINEPETYGGGNYATIGMVLGGISIVLGIVVIVAWFLLGGLAALPI